MNANEKNAVLKQFVGFGDTVQAMINRACIIDYGIIQTFNSGVATVSVSVATDSNDVKIITCVVACLASNTFTVDIEPQKGDKVLVVYPRRYSDEMFDVDKSDIIIDKYAAGYNMLSGIAIPLNQYKSGQHMNFMQLKNSGLILKLAYDKNNDVNLFSLSVGNDGTVSLKSLSDDKFSFNLNAEGTFSVSNPKASVSVDKDGNVVITGQNSCKIKLYSDGKVDIKGNKSSIEMTDSSVKINGYLEIKAPSV